MIRKKYGVFDPSFTGVTIFFNNKQEWDDYLEIEELKLEPVASEYQNANPDTSISKEELAIWQLFGNRPGPKFIDPKIIKECGSKLLNRFNTNPLYALNTAYTYTHEARHFHDWLICPASFKDFSTQIYNCINIFPIIFKLRDEAPVIVPAPFDKWIKLSNTDKEDQLSYLNKRKHIKDNWKFTSLFENADFLSKIEVLSKQINYYSVFANIKNKNNPKYSTYSRYNDLMKSLYEESAFAVQQQSIFNDFGFEVQSVFCSELIKESSSMHLITNLLYKYKKESELVENSTVLTLITWCFLGNHNEHPVNRIHYVSEYIKKKGVPSNGLSADDIFKRIEKEFNLSSYKENLSESIQFSEDVLGNLLNIAKIEYNGNNNILNDLYEIYKYNMMQRKKIVNLIINDPNVYSIPTEYLDRGTLKIGWPTIRYVFKEKFLKKDDVKLNNQKVLLFYDENGNETKYIQQIIPNSFHEYSWDSNYSTKWAYYSSFISLLFSGKSGYEFDSINAKNELNKIDIKLFNVF